MLKRVLIVEPDAASRRSAVIRIRALGWDVLAVGDLRQVVEIAGGQQPDVIVLGVGAGGPALSDVRRELQSNQLTAAIPLLFGDGTVSNSAAWERLARALARTLRPPE
ncbi:MAG: hypothetical protein JO247_02135 [Chloroflexi bacterium]|nr:hypothetical protein [Chloroflexota bacterium]